MATTRRLSGRVRRFLHRTKPLHWAIGAVLLLVGGTATILALKTDQPAEASENPPETTAEVIELPPAETVPAETTALALNAKVAWTKDEFVIDNLDSFAWNACKLEVNGKSFGDGYGVYVETMAARKRHFVPHAQFKRSDGAVYRFAKAEPTRFTIRCREAHGQLGVYVGSAN
ncbi:hypothetical protein HY375_00615 [Candidatus Berkelbacteria bacterium]|nr:hypothetical protein [Candidatus Berkelbacteria bacterium]